MYKFKRLFSGETKLHVAVNNGDLVKVQRIIAKGEIDIDAQDKDGSTALYLATLTGRFDIAELLIAQGANADIVNKYNRAPLHNAVALENKGDQQTSEIIHMLLRCTNDIKILENAILTTSKVSRISLMQQRIDQMQAHFKELELSSPYSATTTCVESPKSPSQLRFEKSGTPNGSPKSPRNIKIYIGKEEDKIPGDRPLSLKLDLPYISELEEEAKSIIKRNKPLQEYCSTLMKYMFDTMTAASVVSSGRVEVSSDSVDTAIKVVRAAGELIPVVGQAATVVTSIVSMAYAHHKAAQLINLAGLVSPGKVGEFVETLATKLTICRQDEIEQLDLALPIVTTLTRIPLSIAKAFYKMQDRFYGTTTSNAKKLALEDVGVLVEYIMSGEVKTKEIFNHRYLLQELISMVIGEQVNIETLLPESTIVCSRSDPVKGAATRSTSDSLPKLREFTASQLKELEEKNEQRLKALEEQNAHKLQELEEKSAHKLQALEEQNATLFARLNSLNKRVSSQDKIDIMGKQRNSQDADIKMFRPAGSTLSITVSKEWSKSMENISTQAVGVSSEELSNCMVDASQLSGVVDKQTSASDWV